jgi:hypothetical protein
VIFVIGAPITPGVDSSKQVSCRSLQSRSGLKEGKSFIFLGKNCKEIRHDLNQAYAPGATKTPAKRS